MVALTLQLKLCPFFFLHVYEADKKVGYGSHSCSTIDFLAPSRLPMDPHPPPQLYSSSDFSPLELHIVNLLHNIFPSI